MCRIVFGVPTMKKACFFLLSLFSVGVIAVEQFHPYGPGSVYNLKTYLPWQRDTNEIVAYPIGCSVNSLADFALQSFFPDSRGSFADVFHDQCARHDLCYRHGYYTYHLTKDDCDDEFADGLGLQCGNFYRGDEFAGCQRVAGMLIMAARKFGHLSYHADDYRVRDYGYYYEYLDDRTGRYALLWSLLGQQPDVQRKLYESKINGNVPLPSKARTRDVLHGFFRNELDLAQLLKALKGPSQ